MEKFKKALSWTLSAALLAGSLTLPAAAKDSIYSDVQGHWGETAITEWSGYGVLNGHGNGTFGPDDAISRAQMAQVLYQTLGLPKSEERFFLDVPEDAWYAEAVNACAAAGIINGYPGGTFEPEAQTSREQTFVLMARTLQVKPSEDLSMLGAFSDGDQVSDWAAPTVAAMVEAGLVQGSGGKLSPERSVTRAATVTVLDNAVTTYIHEPGDYNLDDADTSGIVMVAAEDVTLRGQVHGDILIAQGAAKSETVLQDVQVDGTLSVLAEGAELTVAGNSKLASVEVNAAAENAAISVEKGASIAKVESAASGVAISGQGQVASVVVSGDNTSVNTPGTSVEVSEDVQGTEVNGKPVEGGSNVDSTPGNGGSTGGGSGSGGSGGSGSSHTHTYEDGICPDDGSIDPTYAQASTAEELQAALEAGKNVVVTGVIGSATENTQYDVTSPVVIRGSEGSKVYGSFVIKTDGVSMVKMTVENPGKDTYGEVFKNAVNAHTKDLTLRDCVFQAGAEFANGVVIFPSGEEVRYNLTGNVFRGYDKGEEGWSTTGLMITSLFDLSGKTFLDTAETSTATNMGDSEDLAIIENNTFESCANGYVRNAWESSETVYAALNYKAFTRAAEGAAFYFSDEDLDLTTGAEFSNAIRIILMDGRTLQVDANASKLPVNLTVSLSDGSLTAMGTAVDNQDQLLTLLGFGEGARLHLADGATAQVVFGERNAKPVLTIHGDVEVPADQTAYTHFGSEGDIIGAEITIHGNLTVNGTLKVTSANGSGVSGSSLTVQGDLLVNGTLTKAAKGELTVSGTTSGEGIWPGKEDA